MAHDAAPEPESEEVADEAAAEDSNSLLNRRSYMKLSAAAAAAMGTAAVTGTASAATTRHGISFDRVVNAVDDLGWDPEGNEPIDVPTDEGLLIEVPAGEYVFPLSGSEPHCIGGALRRWGIRGLGDSRNDVSFRTASGDSGYFIRSDPDSEGLLLENFEWDNTDDHTGGDIGNWLQAQDKLVVKDIDHVGFSGREPYCRWSILPEIKTAGGSGRIVNYTKTGPSVFAGHGASDGAGGVFSHEGLLTFENCVIANQGGDGGLYTGKHNGKIVYDSCEFRNNDMAAIRAGAGCELRNCLILIDWDNAHPDNVIDDEKEPTGTAGLYLSTAEYGKSGGGVYNCNFVFKSTYYKGMAGIHVNNSDGNFDIHDTRIQVDIDRMPAIWGGNPADQRFSSHETPEKPWGLDIRNVSITGSGDMRDDGAIFVENRHGTTIADSCIQTPNADGVHIDSARNCTIQNTNINAGGRATVFNNSSVDTSGVTKNDSCPLPDASSPVGSGGSNDGSTELEGQGKRLVVKADANMRYHVRGDNVRVAADNEGPTPTLDTDDDGAYGALVQGESVALTMDSYSVARIEPQDAATMTLDGDVLAVEDYGTMSTPAWEVGESVPIPEEVPEDDGSSDVPEDLLTLEATSGLRYHVRGTNVRVAADNEGPTPTIDVDDRGAYGALAAGETVRLRVDSFNVARIEPQNAATMTLGGEVIPVEEYGTMSTPAWEVGETVTIPEEPTLDPEWGDLPGKLLTLKANDDMRYHVRGDNVRLVEDSDDRFPTIDVDDRGAYGALAAGQSAHLLVDSFNVARVEPRDAATMTLDGEVIPVEEYGTMSTPAWEVGEDVPIPESTPLPSDTISVVGLGPAATYQFTAEESVVPNPNKGTLDDGDNISDKSVEGAVTTGTDSYRFSGSLTHFELSGEAAVYVNGEQVSPDLLGTDQDARLSDLIVVDGTGSSGRCDYEFSVDGHVAKSPELGSVEAEDSVEGGTVAGSVEGERDAYRFAGRLTGFNMDGSATIRFRSN